jgi:uncharacterized coiled-coil DUF342 family protein
MKEVIQFRQDDIVQTMTRLNDLLRQLQLKRVITEVPDEREQLSRQIENVVFERDELLAEWKKNAQELKELG